MAIIKLDGGYNALPISYKRGNPIPLDTTAVWYDEAKLIEYAKTGVTAYVGQVLTLVDSTNNTATAYVIANTAGDLEPIGTAPIGDEKTIIVAEDGTVSLKGITTLVFERDIVGEDGEPTGEKENVQYQPLMTKDGLVWVEPSKTTVEGLATLIEALTQRVTGLEGKVGKAAEGEAEATGLYKLVADETARATEAEGVLEDRIETLEGKEDKDTTYSVKEGEKILSLDGTAFGTTLKLAYNDTKIQILGIGDALVTELDASAFVADGVLEDVDYDADNDKLIFTWNVIDPETSAKKKVEVDVKDLVDTYTAGNGITIESNVVSAKVDATDKYLTVDETGIHTKDIDNAIAAAEGRAATDAQEKANTAKSEAIADADAKLANKANVTDVYTKSQVYNQDEIDELLDNIQAGSSESAASVKTQLDSYKKVVNTEVWGNEEGIGDSRIDRLEAVGAQANVIESVVAAEGAKITATKEGKTVTINDSALVALINTAQTQADKGVTDAGNAQTTADGAASKAQANETAIGTINTTIAEHTSTLGEHSTAIGKNTTDIATLVGRVDGHDTALAGKADKSVETTVAGHTTELAGLTSRMSSAEGAIATKANSADVYTKTEINDKTGTITEGKTLVQMIAEAQDAATYDDTQIKKDIKANTDAIAILNGNAETAGSVAKIASDTAKAEVAAIVDSAPEAFDTLKEIATWIAEDETATEALVERVTANETAVKTTLPAAIAQALTDAKAYTDEKMVKADGVTIVNTEGTFSVGAVSTDNLIQGTKTLILNGGKADVPPVEE